MKKKQSNLNVRFYTRIGAVPLAGYVEIANYGPVLAIAPQYGHHNGQVKQRLKAIVLQLGLIVQSNHSRYLHLASIRRNSLFSVQDYVH